MVTGVGSAGFGEGVRLVVALDEELVAGIAAGDRRDLADLYERHRGPLSAFLRLYTTDAGLIEELVQDTMLAAWKGADRFAGRSSVRSWLFAIARRRAADVLRRKSLPVDSDEMLSWMPGPDPGPEQQVLSGLGQDDLLDAILSLPEIQREVLMLNFVQELSYKEAAEVLGVPVGTIKSRLNSARMMLRQRVRKEDWA